MALTRSSDSSRRSGLGLARRNYVVRAVAFAWSFFVVGLLGWQRELPLAFWVALPSFLVWPQLLLVHALRSRDPRRAERRNVFADALFWGAWIAALEFPVWVAYPALTSVTLNGIVARGVKGAFLAAALFAAGAAAWLGVFGLRYSPATSPLVSALCFFGALGYTLAVGYMVNVHRERLLAARALLREGEARYRLITENAADLIAMVDRSGGWIYASPSHANIFEAGDLAPGTDALRRLHPDDAAKMRAALIRAAGSGTDEELALRLHDRYGRTRQLRTRVHPVAQAGAPAQLLLVSQDETYKRESEEQLLLAGQAMEGMAEGIMVTTAEGTVQSVNRAFSQITGYARDEVVGKRVEVMRSGLQPPEFYDEMLATVQRDGHWTGIKWNKRKNGSVYKEWRSVRAVRDAAGRTTHYVTLFSEVAPRP
jgi:PAS domain S-box-containing protein